MKQGVKLRMWRNGKKKPGKRIPPADFQGKQ
jgi:hypothetical protein